MTTETENKRLKLTLTFDQFVEVMNWLDATGQAYFLTRRKAPGADVWFCFEVDGVHCGIVIFNYDGTFKHAVLDMKDLMS